ncbi:NAD(P)-dependent alcohol dehydrogenase [Salinibacter sp. 10B]|uniref:NAD(P)-dependent alcohol dehydrogenase n=1 Tax=Salinibacter sp. 10B TaxID=1923971 RepID=UPI000CF55174|nr:NAD(P)-dependent alcohol dehydrogenase [Salinibacter sp. 10B]
MKTIVQHEYGGPEALHLDERPVPAPDDEEVLVKVQAASVNAGDWHLMRGRPFLVRFMAGGLFRPTATIGSDVAGTVEALGPKASQFDLGDAVIGDLSTSGFGGFAEYACVPEAVLIPKPESLSLKDAAAVPVAGLAALQGLRDCGHIEAGQHVLINGASGGVGTFAVQIAKAFGATVTAVCSPEKMDAVQSLKPDRVIDYEQEDVTQLDTAYDLILDAAAYRSPRAYLDILRPGGTYVLVGGSPARLFQVMFLAPVVSIPRENTIEVLLSSPNQEDLHTLSDLIDDGKLAPLIDRRFSLGDVPDAIQYVEARRGCGKVVITM